MTAKLISLPKSDTPEPDWSRILTEATAQAAASEYWHQTIAEMRQAGTLSPVNGPQIKRYVLALVIFDQQAAMLINEGPVLIANKTKLPYHNPRWSVYKDADTQANLHEDRLGLTPRRRAQVAPAKKTKTAGVADKFLNQA